MLQFPDSGFSRSITQHNSDLQVAADWVLATVLFDEEAVGRADVVDQLLEHQLYDDQDFAGEFVSSIWSDLRTSARLMGAASPVKFQDHLIVRCTRWEENAPLSFCLLLSLGPKFEGWSGQFKNDYTEQGELFELLSAQALRELLPGWTVTLTGWSRANAMRIADIAPALVDELGEAPGNLDRYGNDDAKECGLDLVFYRPFDDGRGGRPTYLAQCASGSNWARKSGSPDMGIWTRVIDFCHNPSKAFLIPFALDRREFELHAASIQGLLLDRRRLLSVMKPPVEWIDGELQDRLRVWIQQRLDWLHGRRVFQ